MFKLPKEGYSLMYYAKILLRCAGAFLTLCLLPCVASCDGQTAATTAQTAAAPAGGSPSAAPSAAAPQTTVFTGETVNVTTDPGAVLYTSPLTVGTTTTHAAWYNDPAADNVAAMLNRTSKISNQAIMGWGADDPWPDPNGPEDFSSLDSIINGHLSKLNGQLCVTFCSAPGWMKDTGNDWDMESAVKDDPATLQAFAKLCADIAARYPDVKYFQVWNEFKGMWNTKSNDWDYARYTRLYNAVYDAVKAVRPDAQIGGFYIVLDGDGTRPLFGNTQNDGHTGAPITSKELAGMKYWLQNMHGADFICVDRCVKDFHDDSFNVTPQQMFQLTPYFADIEQQLAAVTSLPIWWAEFYGDDDPAGQTAYGENFIGAMYASIYMNMIAGAPNSSVTALFWMEYLGNTSGGLFTDTSDASGGQPTQHANVMENINRYFGAGARIIASASSSGDVQVMATAETVMLINTTDQPLQVTVNGGAGVVLEPFGVEFLGQ